MTMIDTMISYSYYAHDGGWYRVIFFTKLIYSITMKMENLKAEILQLFSSTERLSNAQIENHLKDVSKEEIVDALNDLLKSKR